MKLLLSMAFLFFVGAMIGWCIEFLFRNLISHKGPRGKYFINPGFCKGPWLPIYGIGLAAMCIIAYFCTGGSLTGTSEVPAIWVILMMSIAMNVIEFIGGYVLLKVFNMRLWDYRDRWGNIMGITCPLFALIWTAIAAVYYLFLHRTAMNWLLWLYDHKAYFFVVGLFWGFFIIDFISSMKVASAIKKYGDKYDVIIKIEELKQAIQKKRLDQSEELKFFNEIAAGEKEAIEAAIAQHTHTTEDKATAIKSHRTKAYRQSQKNK
ncbi:MAG: putative ABC transporter permease [Lachnospiraceae bacterium]|nr:putative ABC transporter permease [Lachnospiraceae bacterium]